MLKKASLGALCAILSLAALSCGSQEPARPENGSEPVSAPASGTEAETEVFSSDVNQLPEPELPDMDFGGADYQIYSEWVYSSSSLFPADLFIAAEALNGEIVNDAVFNRNLKVRERFNTTVKKVDASMSAASLILAGEPLDLVMSDGVELGYAVSSGAYQNFIDTPYINFDREYWYPQFVEGTHVDGRVFFMPSEICLDPVINTAIFYFNKRLFSEHDLDNPYDLVDSGTWTVDEYLNLVKTVHGDLNGDGIMDAEDLYGTLVKTEFRFGAYLQLYFGCGKTFTKADPDEGRIIVTDGEFCQGLIDKIFDVFKDKTVTKEWDGYEYTEYRRMFAEGHALFCMDEIGAMDNYREMEDDFGVLPIPKYDVEQQGYFHRVWPGVGMFAIPASAPDLDKTGIVAEYMAWISHNTILPAYYEITIQQKRTRDPRDIDMLEVIRKTLVFDFADIYDTHLTNWFWDSYSYHSYALRVGASWKYLTKRNQKFVKMVRGLD
ncbi:MAG: carbohydrate ABC transporter substrate-binding protein [Clostridia bacterium]|nr:carbohydrate ABC transporter substrate-binding protein [Clostridia bacterium]